MSDQPDYYKILNVSPEATEDQIRKSYKKLAIKWHPDKNPDNRKEAEEKFKQISEAYSVLGDKDKRREYDAYKNGMNFDFDFDFGKNFNPFDMFKHAFGGKNPFEDIEKHFGMGGFGDFGKFGFGDDDDDNDFFNNFSGEGSSIKTSTTTINGKTVTKTEKTTYENGKKKVEIIEKSSDGHVKQYFLDDKGNKIDSSHKRIKNK